MFCVTCSTDFQKTVLRSLMNVEQYLCLNSCSL